MQCLQRLNQIIIPFYSLTTSTLSMDSSPLSPIPSLSDYPKAVKEAEEELQQGELCTIFHIPISMSWWREWKRRWDGGVNLHSDEEGEVGEGREDGTVEDVGDTGYEYLLEDLKTG